MTPKVVSTNRMIRVSFNNFVNLILIQENRRHLSNDLKTPQATTIIYHHMKKSIIKENTEKYKNMGGLNQKSYANKNDT